MGRARTNQGLAGLEGRVNMNKSYRHPNGTAAEPIARRRAGLVVRRLHGAHYEPPVPHSAHGQLRWQCRRGMLELDYILENFVAQHYEGLELEQKRLFVRMLDFEDQLLLDWVMGNVVPSDANIREIVKIMQQKIA